MKLTNAIKKMSKYGEVKKVYNNYTVVYSGRAIEVTANGDPKDADCSIATVRVRRLNDADDMMTDYSAGVYCDNLSQAIRLAEGR